MVTHVKVADLSDLGVTRTSGRAAFERLKEFLRSGESLDVDISEDRPLSLSFLDELVFQLSGSGDLNRVTFLIADTDVRRKLQRVAGMRGIALRYRRTGPGRRTARMGVVAAT